MTNPDNIVRVRARRGGRASVYEANGWCQAFSQGVLDGVGVIPNTVPDLNVLVGGTPTCPDVVIATNPVGYKIALDIVGQEAITLTAPASNSRISAIIAYTDDLALSTTENEVTGSPATCGLIVVNGPTSANPVPPSDTEIRAAITEDGAAGSQASYAVIATVTVSASTTLITDSLISVNSATLMSRNINFEAIADLTPVNFSVTVGSTKLTIPGYKIKFANGMTLVGCATAESTTYPAVSNNATHVRLEYGIEFEMVYAGSMQACSATAPDTYLMYNKFYPAYTDSYVNSVRNSAFILSFFLLGKEKTTS